MTPSLASQEKKFLRKVFFAIHQHLCRANDGAEWTAEIMTQHCDKHIPRMAEFLGETFGRFGQRLIDRRARIEKLAAIGKAVRRNIEHTHNQRALAKHQRAGAQLRANYRAGALRRISGEQRHGHSESQAHGC